MRFLKLKAIRSISRRPELWFGASCVVFALLSLGLFKLDYNFGAKVWFPKNDPVLTQFERFEERYGNDDNVIIVVSSEAPFSHPEAMGQLRFITEQLWKIKGVATVDSLVNFQVIESQHDELVIGPLIENSQDREQLDSSYLSNRLRLLKENEKPLNYLVSKDLHTAMVIGYLQPGFEKKVEKTLIHQEVKRFVQLQSTEGFEYQVSGLVAYQGSLVEVILHDFVVLTVVLSLLLGAIIYAIFGSYLVVVATFFLYFASILATQGMVGWIGLTVDPLSVSIPQILIAVCLADAIHIFAKMAAANNQRSLKWKLRRAMSTNALPTLLTSLTTMAGFLSLTSAELFPVQTLGLFSAVGTGLAWVFTFTLMVPFVLLFADKELPLSRFSLWQKRFLNFQNHLSAFVLSYRPQILFGFFVLTSGLIALVGRLSVNDDFDRFFAKEHPFRAAGLTIEQEIGGYGSLEVSLDSGHVDGVKDPVFLSRVDQLHRHLEKNPAITKTLSARDIVSEMQSALTGGTQKRMPSSRMQVAEALLLYSMNTPVGNDLSRWIDAENREMRFRVWWKVSEVSPLEMIQVLKTHMTQMGLKGEITGKYKLMSHLPNMIVESFFSSLWLSFLFIFMILFLLFKSLRTAAVAMLPNILPLSVGGGFMYLMNIPLDVGTATVAGIVLGVAVDDTIHFLVAYNRAQQRFTNPQQALNESYRQSMMPLVLTTIVLVAGFTSFFIADFLPLRELGMVTAVAVAYALLVDLVLLPALLFKPLPRTTDLSEFSHAPPSSQTVS